MTPKISAPIVLVAVVVALIMLMRGQANSVQRAENAGATRVVVAQHDQVIESLRTENARLRAQRNAAWEAETNANEELSRQQAEIERLAARDVWWRAGVPGHFLCSHNATLDLEAGRRAAPCGPDALPGTKTSSSPDQLGGVDEAAAAERGPQAKQ